MLTKKNFKTYKGSVDSWEERLELKKQGYEAIDGDFNCTGLDDDHNTVLTSLVGSPVFVTGDFDCSYNKLTSFEGAPKDEGGGRRPYCQ